MISIITNDGRNYIGRMKGSDQCTNVILCDSFERVYSTKAGVEIVELGLYIIRGDNISIIGDIHLTAEMEQYVAKMKSDDTRAAPLKPVVH